MFKRYEDNPIISRTPNTFYSKHVANPDLLEFDNKYFLYFRGQSEACHDQLGVLYVKKENFDGVTWTHYENNPIIKVSDDKSAFDSIHLLDPATIVIDKKIYLYYSGHSYDKESGIGLAISEDGFNFTKHTISPVINGAIAPEVIKKDGLIHLFYQRKVKEGVFNFFCTTSTDGIHFDKSKEKLIFTQSNIKDTFDEISITTGRIWLEDDTYYMTYGGCNKFADYPIAFGIAKSKDLFNWSRYPDNPILKRGAIGEWDEGAMWFGTIYKHKGIYYMWYEGTGAGLGTKTKEAQDASKLCRNNDYGGYASINFSQTGLATYKGKMPKW